MKRERVDIDRRYLAVVPDRMPPYDDPDVQAVACELLGDPLDNAYWSKPVETNPATALHAAVRAVHVIRRRGTPVDGAALRELVRFAGEMSGMLTPRHTEQLEQRVRALAEGLRS